MDILTTKRSDKNEDTGRNYATEKISDSGTLVKVQMAKENIWICLQVNDAIKWSTGSQTVQQRALDSLTLMKELR